MSNGNPEDALNYLKCQWTNVNGEHILNGHAGKVRVFYLFVSVRNRTKTFHTFTSYLDMLLD